MSPRPRAKDYVISLPNDLASSIVVFLVALPLCIGIALASGAPMLSGIIAGICGGLVVGLASRSHLSVSGPAAGLTAIVLAAIATIGSFQGFLVAVVLAGLLQLILGFCKAGIIGDYIPNSVIKGMLAAIGFILILNQVPHLLGDDSHFESDEGVKLQSGNLFSNFFSAFGNIHNSALFIGGLCLVLYFVWNKWVSRQKGWIKLVPAPLLIVCLGVGINTMFIQSNPGIALQGEHLVEIPVAKSAHEFFSFFTFPDWQFLFQSEVIIVAITLALVASLETLLCIEAVDDLDPYQRVTPTNRELKAQGLGNIVSGLIGGLPVTSVIVRSSANVNAGAKTKMSTIYHGIFLLLSLAFIPFLLNMIPKTALAAILIFTGYKLASPAVFKAFFKKGWDQFLPFLITIIAILSTDLLKGVIIGIAVGLFFVIRSNFKTAVFVVNDKSKYLFRLRKDVSFLNKPIIKNKLEKVPAESKVIIDATRADFIDTDVIEVIEDFVIHAPLKNIQVEIKHRRSNEKGFAKILQHRGEHLLVRNYQKEITFSDIH